MTSPSPQQQRDQILQQIAQIDSMIRGHLSEQTLKTKRASGTASYGPYYTLQRHENGTNNCQRIAAEELQFISEGVLGHARFMELTRRYGEVMCIGTDGTGAPMRRAYLRGRKGKRGGRARTREVKVGTVFTHRRPTAPDQRPERDYQSTSYLAAIVSSEHFGPLLRHEAIRRGMGWAKTVVFLGDGAVWVWKVARLNFPGAVCILDYYHACEHLNLLAAAIYGEGTPPARRHYRLW